MFCPVKGCTRAFKHLEREQWHTALRETCPHHSVDEFGFEQGREAHPSPNWAALYPSPQKYLEAQLNSKESVDCMSSFYESFIRKLRVPTQKTDGATDDWYDSSHAQQTARALTVENPFLASQIFMP